MPVIRPTEFEARKVGIYIESVESSKIPHVEICKDGKLHTDGCLKDRLDQLTAVSGQLRGIFTKGVELVRADLGVVAKALHSPLLAGAMVLISK